VRITLSNGTTVQVTPVALGNERLFACLIGVSPTGYTAYDAAGKVLAHGSMTSGAMSASPR
jgi:hypothetical protein